MQINFKIPQVVQKLQSGLESVEDRLTDALTDKRTEGWMDGRTDKAKNNMPPNFTLEDIIRELT